MLVPQRHERRFEPRGVRLEPRQLQLQLTQPGLRGRQRVQQAAVVGEHGARVVGHLRVGGRGPRHRWRGAAAGRVLLLGRGRRGGLHRHHAAVGRHSRHDAVGPRARGRELQRELRGLDAQRRARVAQALQLRLQRLDARRQRLLLARQRSLLGGDGRQQPPRARARDVRLGLRRAEAVRRRVGRQPRHGARLEQLHLQRRHLGLEVLQLGGRVEALAQRLLLRLMLLRRRRGAEAEAARRLGGGGGGGCGGGRRR